MEKLKSKIWFQDIKEIIAAPYDYENQESFMSESVHLLDEIYKLYDSYQLKFNLHDRSLEKCLWMLQIDALDTLRDCLYLMKNKKHRIVGKMFRDVIETLDLAHLIKGNPDKFLEKWYKNESINHEEYRKYLKNLGKGEEAEIKKQFYKILSRWTHHAHVTLLRSYSLGGDDMLVYDSHNPGILVLQETITEYLWILKILIIKFLEEIKFSELFNNNQLQQFYDLTHQKLVRCES